MRNITKYVCSAVVLTGLLCAGSASAGFTTVGSSSETSHIEILNHIYGPGFTGATPFGGLSYTNGTITATRVDDYGVGSPLNLSTGAPGVANDQTWSDGVVNASAHARFASFPQRFGYDTGADGGYQQLFAVMGSGFDVTGGVQNFSFGGLFSLARRTAFSVNYSRNDLNFDQADHMLTYEITGLGQKTWLLFWEDSFMPFADADYNDLVVELQVVPVPAAVLLGGIGVGMVVWLRRWASLPS